MRSIDGDQKWSLDLLIVRNQLFIRKKGGKEPVSLLRYIVLLKRVSVQESVHIK